MTGWKPHRRLAALAVSLAALLVLSPSLSVAADRVALIIGNGKYAAGPESRAPHQRCRRSCQGVRRDRLRRHRAHRCRRPHHAPRLSRFRREGEWRLGGGDLFRRSRHRRRRGELPASGRRASGARQLCRRRGGAAVAARRLGRSRRRSAPRLPRFGARQSLRRDDEASARQADRAAGAGRHRSGCGDGGRVCRQERHDRRCRLEPQ